MSGALPHPYDTVLADLGGQPRPRRPRRITAPSAAALDRLLADAAIGEWRQVIRRDGALLFRAPWAAGRGETVRRLTLQISAAFGELLPQNGSGVLLREVRDRGTRIGEGDTSRYSDSRRGGSFHTDGAEAALPPPDYFALGCVRQAPLGGALELISVEDLLGRLAAQPDVIETLAQPFHFDRRGDAPPGERPSVLKPILIELRDGQGISYLREYVLAGHRHPGTPPLTPRQERALRALDGTLRDGALVQRFRLAPGDVAIIDNLQRLHARTAFMDVPGRRRLLLRTWVRCHTGSRCRGSALEPAQAPVPANDTAGPLG